VRWLLAVVGAILLAAGVLAAVVLFHHYYRGIPTHTATRPTITGKGPPPQNESLPWPTYGADNFRTRAVTATGVRPPFNRQWTWHGHTLLELPPVAGYGLLYEETFNGFIHAIDPATGKEKWQHPYDSRRCGWSSPALGGGRLFATFIGSVHRACAQLPNGGLVALDARTGKVLWSRNIGQSEVSPLFSHGIVYFGSTDGGVYAYAAKTGRKIWSYNTGGAVKGSPTVAHGRLFIGNYGGNFYALNARTGGLIWRSGGHGSFYAGPSVVDGRVYEGSNDGNVYAFSARTGRQLWKFGTGRYVYASPAVWRGIVLVGSYDHRFYAINGATGSERWVFNAGGPISGAASVIDGLVYFSTLNPHRTYALNAAGGRLREKWNDGEYSPAIAGYGHLFLVGVGEIYALEPRDSGSRRQHKR
jgi:outer membrane protein assembly factor BamB